MQRIKLGDVLAIPLPNKKFAFGRIFNDASIAIYNYIGNSVQDLPKNEDYQFIVGVYRDVIISGNWKKIENREFENEEASWPPPNYIFDMISSEYSIYHKGEIHPSSKELCNGLEEAAVWDSNHIIDRILGIKKVE